MSQGFYRIENISDQMQEVYVESEMQSMAWGPFEVKVLPKETAVKALAQNSNLKNVVSEKIDDAMLRS